MRKILITLIIGIPKNINKNEKMIIILIKNFDLIII